MTNGQRIIDGLNEAIGHAKAMTEPSNLAEALPAEIKRVRDLQDVYKSMRGMPQVMVEPAIMMMEQAIQEGVSAAASGDVIRMLRAYNDLKGFEK